MGRLNENRLQSNSAFLEKVGRRIYVDPVVNAVRYVPTTAAETLTFSGSTIVRSAGDFTTDGFAPGDVVRIASWASDDDQTGGNKGTFICTGAVALTLTFAGVVFTLNIGQLARSVVITTGDGSSSFPYGSIEAGFADIRNGRGDIVVFSGPDLSAPYRPNRQMIVSSSQSASQQNEWKLESPFGASLTAPLFTFGGRGVAAQSAAPVFVGATQATFSVTAHGLLEDDHFAYVGPEAGANQMNKLWTVDAAPAANSFTATILTNATSTPVTLVDNVTPFGSAADSTGILVYPSLVVNTASGCTIHGLSLTSDIFQGSPTKWTVMAILNGRGLVSGCAFPTSALILDDPVNWRVEGCEWILNNIGNGEIDALTAVLPILHTVGGRLAVTGNSFKNNDADVDWDPAGMVLHAYNPIGAGGHRFIDNIIGSGMLAGEPDNIVAAAGSIASISGVQWQRNLYVGEDPTQAFELTASGPTGLRDVEPTSAPDTQELNTQSEVIWERSLDLMGEVPDTAGSVILRAAYPDGVHFNAASGNTNTVPGEDGIHSNPVSTEAALRSLSDNAKLNLNEIKVQGALTLTQAWDGFQFEGTTPQSDIVLPSGNSILDSTFININLRGNLGSTNITGQQCIIGNFTSTTTGVQGIFDTCAWRDTIRPSGACRLIDGKAEGITNGIGDEITTIDLASTSEPFLADGISGLWRFENQTAAGDIMGIVAKGADIQLKSTITNGFGRFFGYGQMDNRSTGGDMQVMMQISSVSLMGAFSATAGATSTVIPTSSAGLAWADDYFNDKVLVVVENPTSGRVTASRITDYVSATGTFTVFPALEFTPLLGHRVYVQTVDQANEAVSDDVTALRDAVIGHIRIDRTTDPWQEVHFDEATGLVETNRYDLLDGSGASINDANPIVGFFIKERNKV